MRDPSQGRLNGGYLFGDACSDNLWLMDPAGDQLRQAILVAKMGRTLSSIGEAEDGSVYATSLGQRRTAPDLRGVELTVDGRA